MTWLNVSVFSEGSYSKYNWLKVAKRTKKKELLNRVSSNTLIYEALYYFLFCTATLLWLISPWLIRYENIKRLLFRKWTINQMSDWSWNTLDMNDRKVMQKLTQVWLYRERNKKTQEKKFTKYYPQGTNWIVVLRQNYHAYIWATGITRINNNTKLESNRQGVCHWVLGKKWYC